MAVLTKRFLVFAGFSYYPNGGWDDFKQACNTLEEAYTVGREQKKTYDWVNIVDLNTHTSEEF